MDIIDFFLITLSSVFSHEDNLAIIRFTANFIGNKNILLYV